MAWYFLTEEQAAMIQEVLDYHRGHITPSRSQGLVTEVPNPASDCYVARIPSGGIEACDLSGSPDEPGRAECDIYRIWEGYYGTGASPDLRNLSFKRMVYNLTPAKVPGSIYVLVHKTKFGVWVLGRGAGSNGLVFARLNGALNAGSSVGASIYEFNGTSWSDSGDDETVYDWLMGTGESIADTTKIIAGFYGDYRIVIAARCAE